MRALLLALLLLPACSDDDAAVDAAPDGAPDAAPVDAAPPDAAPAPVENWDRDILTTGLSLDVSTLAGVAVVELAGDATTSASFEIGDLEITEVSDGSAPLSYVIADGPPRRIDVAVPSSTGPATVRFTYSFKDHAASGYDGWMSSSGVTFLWPYFCGNLFPCHSSPADGLSLTATVTGNGALDAVYPAVIPADAPSYMFAVAVGDFTYDEIGVTTAGTHVGVYALPGDQATGLAAGAYLDHIFDWYEVTLGAYTFGDHVASVDANWGAGAYGGMEHHPLWHIGQADFGTEEVHAHEAAHGWYGDGVRIACWEDFVLSEGTTTYLAAKAIAAARGAAAGDEVWAGYQTALDDWVAYGDTIAYPDGCDQIDILTDPLWSGIPYYKGAFFYRAVEAEVGEAALLGVLAGFYADHVGGAAHMQDLLDRIADTGFDPTTLADGWLRSLGHP
jgi:hypothetical protein